MRKKRKTGSIALEYIVLAAVVLSISAGILLNFVGPLKSTGAVGVNNTQAVSERLKTATSADYIPTN